jgi:hypothetical protein
MMRTNALFLTLALAACAPSPPSDPRAAAGTWPPKDYAAFVARPPMSVGAEFDDEWTMAIEAERWSYQIGLAIAAIGTTPPVESGTAAANHLERTAHGLRNAAARLLVLQPLTCKTSPIAKQQDCASFAPPDWLSRPDPSTPSKEEMQARLLWLQDNALQFVFPACNIAIKRTGDERYCAVE